MKQDGEKKLNDQVMVNGMPAERALAVADEVKAKADKGNVFVPGGALNMAKQNTMMAQYGATIVLSARVKVDTENTTLSETKTLMELLRWMPVTSQKFITYKESLLTNMLDKESGFVDDSTTVHIPFNEFVKRIHGAKGKRQEYKDQVDNDLIRLAGRRADSYLNAMIEDKSRWKKTMTNLIEVAHFTEGKTSTKGTVIDRDFIKVKFHDALVYSPHFGIHTWVPNNIVDLLNDYGRNHAVFLRMFWHCIELRSTQTSAKHTTEAVHKRANELKDGKKKMPMDVWNKEMVDAIDKQYTVVFTEKRLRDILKAEMETYYTPNTVKGVTYQKFNGVRFRKHLEDTIDAFVAMGMIEKGHVFTCEDEDLHHVASIYPSRSSWIKQRTKGDGVCVAMKFNKKWTGREPLPAVEVKAQKTDEGNAPQ